MSAEHPRFGQDAVPAGATPPSSVDPAIYNTSLEWIKLCAKIGFTVVVVKAPWSPELWQNSGFEEDLGSELTEANLGHYDSAKYGKHVHSDGAKYGNPVTFFFCVHSPKLPAALRLIKDRLAAIGLLPHVKIAYADLDPLAWRRVSFLEGGKASA